jgi:hypothetical protein
MPAPGKAHVRTHDPIRHKQVLSSASPHSSSAVLNSTTSARGLSQCTTECILKGPTSVKGCRPSFRVVPLRGSVMPPITRVSPPPPQCLPRLVNSTMTLPRWKAATTGGGAPQATVDCRSLQTAPDPELWSSLATQYLVTKAQAPSRYGGCSSDTPCAGDFRSYVCPCLVPPTIVVVAVVTAD